MQLRGRLCAVDIASLNGKWCASQLQSVWKAEVFIRQVQQREQFVVMVTVQGLTAQDHAEAAGTGHFLPRLFFDLGFVRRSPHHQQLHGGLLQVLAVRQG